MIIAAAATGVITVLISQINAPGARLRFASSDGIALPLAAKYFTAK